MADITINGTLPALIDVTRAQLNSYLAGLNTTELSNLIAAASDKIRRYCKRNFSSAQYTGYYDGGAYPYDVFFLPEIPIISVSRLATNPTVVLTVQNSSSANQRATVATTSTGITLYRVASGAETTDTSVTFAANITVQAVATAINALGNGWLATPTSGYELYPSKDFKIVQGALSAIAGNGAELIQHVEEPEFGGYGFFDGAQPWMVSSAWRLDKNRGVIFGVFPQGQQNIRCDWTSGFASVPDAVQEATVLTCIAISRAKLINPAFSSVSLGGASTTIALQNLGLPKAAKDLLQEYIDYAGSRV